MELKTCGCGRSPTGRCTGWHNLDEPEYLSKLDELVQAMVKFQETKINESTYKDTGELDSDN